jgi:hypothetical protein
MQPAINILDGYSAAADSLEGMAGHTRTRTPHTEHKVAVAQSRDRARLGNRTYVSRCWWSELNGILRSFRYVTQPKWTEA